MELFSSSPNWMIALGKTLLNSLWVGVVIYGLLRFLLTLARRQPGILRYRLSFGAQLLFAALTGIIFLSLYEPRQEMQDIVSPLLFQFRIPYEDAVQGTRFHSFLRYCCLLYFAGLFATATLALSGYQKLRQVRRTALNAPRSLQDLFEALHQKLLPGRKIRLAVSERVTVPFVTGVLKPVVIVPTGFFTQLSFDQVELILMHEIMHIKRLDHLANLVQRVTEILFFYHPALRAISSITRREREICCDERVLGEGHEALDYAGALYQLAAIGNHFGKPVLSAAGDHRHQLAGRIQRILNEESMKISMKHRFSTLVWVATGMMILVLVTGFKSGLSFTEYNQARKEVIHSEDPPSQPAAPEEIAQASAVGSPAASPDPAAIAEPLSAADLAAIAELAELSAVPESPLAPNIPSNPAPLAPLELMQPDTLDEEVMEGLNELEAIDWDEIQEIMEEARIEALEEMDWDQIQKIMEEARIHALEEIDWEALKEEMRSSMESIDWEALKNDIHCSFDSLKTHVITSEEWEKIHEEFRSAQEQARKTWESMDWEQLRMEIDSSWTKSMESIDWEEIKKQMEQAGTHMDSIWQNFNWEHDFDFDHDFFFDHDIDFDHHFKFDHDQDGELIFKYNLDI